MRIITYCRINISTGETLEEQAYEYDGPVALCGRDPGADGYGDQGTSGNMGTGTGGLSGGESRALGLSNNVNTTEIAKIAIAALSVFAPQLAAVVAIGFKAGKALGDILGTTDAVSAMQEDGVTPDQVKEKIDQAGGENGVENAFSALVGENTQEAQGTNSSRPMWDQFIDAWFGIKPYENAKAQKDFQEYFKTAQPGDTQEWAGGTITMGADGSATYQPANGQPIQINAQSDMEDLYNNYSGIANAWDEQYPINTALDSIRGHADYLGQAANTYQDTIQGATDKQNGLLDSLIADSQSGAGLYKPVRFGLGNQTISFVPGNNMKQAGQQAEFGQYGLGNTNTTAGNILNTASTASPYAGDLSALAAMQQAMGLEEARRQADLDEAYRQLALKEGIAVQNKEADNNAPGLLDQIIGGIYLGNKLLA